MGGAVYVRLLQLASVQEGQTVLAQLSAELPGQLRLPVLLLRAAERASTHSVRLAPAPAVRYSVTTEFRLLVASLLSPRKSAVVGILRNGT